MHHTQGTQGFDQLQLTRVEGEKLFVAFNKFDQLTRLGMSIARQQQPDILNGRAINAIIEIYKMGQIIPPEYIADVAIAMQTNGVKAVALPKPVYLVYDVPRQGFVSCAKAQGNKLVFEQECLAVVGPGFNVKAASVLECF